FRRQTRERPRQLDDIRLEIRCELGCKVEQKRQRALGVSQADIMRHLASVSGNDAGALRVVNLHSLIRDLILLGTASRPRSAASREAYLPVPVPLGVPGGSVTSRFDASCKLLSRRDLARINLDRFAPSLPSGILPKTCRAASATSLTERWKVLAQRVSG